MHVLQGFVEIGQDAAAVIEGDTPGVVGVFTDSIQTCMVAAFECTNGFVVVHDSAQLQFSEISGLIGSMGRCKKLAIAVPIDSQSLHAERINRLKTLTGATGKNFIKLVVSSSVYAVSYSPEEGLEVHAHGSTAASLPLPEKQDRISVAEINNFFIKPNSKSLLVDVQFSGGKFNKVKPIQKTIDQLLEIVSEQPNYFFNNAAFLHAANALDLLSVPSFLVEIVERNALQAYRTNVVPGHDLQRQKVLYNEFISSRSASA